MAKETEQLQWLRSAQFRLADIADALFRISPLSPSSCPGKSLLDRKVNLTPMAAKILVDARPGAREEGIREAARSPRLMGEFLSAWLPVRPSDAYCISELQLDRGFTPEAARAFLKIFDDNVRYANLTDEDVEVDEDAQATEAPEENDAVPLAPDAKRVYESLRNVLAHQSPTFRRPERRMSVTLDGETLSVAATLSTVTDVDRLIAILNANKALLPKKVTEADASEDED